MARDRALTLAIAAEVLRRSDGLAHLQRFLEAGLTRNDVGHLRHLGAVLRPRIGWYLDPAAPAAAAEAVRVGGVLGCVSAAETYGIFIPDGLDGRRHVSLEPDTTRMRSSWNAAQHVHAGQDPMVRLHWDRRSDALAESAGETFIRLELGDRSIPCRPQGWLTSLYRTDVLVEEWLPVESDGVKHHAGKAVVKDRERDAVLAHLDRQPLRFTHLSAVRETAWVGDVIERVWRRGR